MNNNFILNFDPTKISREETTFAVSTN